MLDRLTEVLERARHRHTVGSEDLTYLLSLQAPEAIGRVLAAAREVRRDHFGDRIFLYGFIYLSTYCRNHCSFCFYRASNSHSPRYRKNVGQILEIATRLEQSGVHLVDLTLGEDPEVHTRGDFDLLYDVVSRIRETVALPIMLSPGIVPDQVLSNFKNLGVDWYALYQETHTPPLYATLRLDQSFPERMQKRLLAQRLGMLTEDGLLLGIGETVQDRVRSIRSMQLEGVRQARVMSFVPQTGTPLADHPSPPRTHELLTIAVMRLAMPSRLIPASLDVDGLQGLENRLEAGANVVTSIIPPGSQLAGVSRSSLDIEQGLRTVTAVQNVLRALGLAPASLDEYRSWVANQKALLHSEEDIPDADRHRRRAVAGHGSGLPLQGSRP